MSSLPLFLLLLIFVGAAVGVWFAGIRLSHATDVLSKQYGLGQALGGLILLAIATNLPEIAITATGAIKGDVRVAVGNILGGIALQTVVLVLLDAFGMGRKLGLTYSASSIELVIEGRDRDGGSHRHRDGHATAVKPYFPTRHSGGFGDCWRVVGRLIPDQSRASRPAVERRG